MSTDFRYFRVIRDAAAGASLPAQANAGSDDDNILELLFHLPPMNDKDQKIQQYIDSLAQHDLHVQSANSIKTKHGQLTVLRMPIKNHHDKNMATTLSSMHFGSAFKGEPGNI